MTNAAAQRSCSPPPDSPAGSRWPVLLFLAAVLTGCALRLAGALMHGFTSSETALLYHPGSFVSPAWPAIAACIRLWAWTPLSARLLFVAAGSTAVLLTGLCARRLPSVCAPLFSTFLAATAVLWLSVSSDCNPLAFALATVLLLQWAFLSLYSSPDPRSLSVYCAALAVTAFLVPRALLPLLPLHALCLVWALIRPPGQTRPRFRALYYAVALLLMPGMLLVLYILQIRYTVSLSGWPVFSRLATGILNAFSWPFQYFSSAPFDAPGSALVPALGIVLLLVTAISAFRHKSSTMWFWIMSALVPLSLWSISTHVQSGDAGPAGCIAAWPALLIIPGTAVGIFADRAWLFSCRPRTALLIRGLTVAGLFALGIGWCVSQYPGYRSFSALRASEDLSAPAEFLQANVTPDTPVLVVCSNALSVRTATRRYLAPYISHDCVAPVTITSTLSATVLQKYIRSYSPASFWITGPDLSELPVLLSGYYLWCYRFSVPVIQAIPAAECDWPALLKTFSRVSRTGPDSPQPAAPLYAWYACAPDTFLIETLKDGRATADLAYVSPDSLSAARARVRNSALIRLLRFWESGITNYSLETYAPMAEFMSRTCGPDDAAAGRCAVLFSAFLSRAVALSNYTWGTRILHDARRIYPSDPSLLRLAAKMEMTRSKPDISRAVHYNMQACAAYTNQYNRPYFDAWFAAILLERQLYDISYITNQFQLLKKSARAQYEKALASGASEQWINQCLFWEAQCNAYISNILRDGRQYIAAAEWEKHNLDERFPLKRRQPARERLIQLYEAGKNYQALFSMYDECAAAATSGFERLSWLLESANQYITLDMPVRAFEYYERANACLAGLPHEQRDVRATDSRYQRLLRYIEKQLQTDIREPVIATLLERAGANFDNGGWYYIQAAQLYRCRLEYQKAADVFSLGMKAYPAYAPVFIQGAFLQFQLSRYDKAINIFSNLVKYTAANTNTVTTQTDWRYRILTLLDRDRIPPELDAVNAWADQHVSAFSSTGAYYNYRANVLAQFGEFDQATNIFYQGISLDPRFLDNYLDLGYQLCRRSDAAKTGALIDRIQQLHLPEQTRLTIDTDWRFIELHHVSVRPFVLQE